MKAYIHARLTRDDREALERLKARTGRSESDLIRLGIRRAAELLDAEPSALELAGNSAGRFTGGPKDLSTNRQHLDGFGA